MPKTSKTSSRAASISLLGGLLCLDFVNTVDWRTSDKPEEILNTYPDLVDWTCHVGALNDRKARRLKRTAARLPDQAASAFEQAIRLREAIYQIFAALARTKPQPRSQLDKFNRILSTLLSCARISSGRGRFFWSWSGDH